MIKTPKREYLMLKIRGQIVKVDPDIYYKIKNPQHEPPYKKYNEDITTMRLSSESYPIIVRGTKPPLRHIMLSRFIIDAKEGQIVDHINGGRLDNRRRNLRIVTARQNSLNKKCKNKTGFIGVCIRRKRGRDYCRAQFLKSDGQRATFQLPDSPENRIITAFARDKFVLEAGEEKYAPLNFPCFKYEPLRSFLLEEDFNKFKIGR
jgi:hypothetical protein